MICIEVIKSKHYDQLIDFCNACNELGYVNNASIEKMRLLWCKCNGEYWCATQDNKIVAVAGVHTFPEMGPNAWRILFRGCELPGESNFKGLSKGDWKSITQRDFIPIFIDYCDSDELYITTNIEGSGHHMRNHRLMGLLAKQGILIKIKDCIINNTLQTVWQLNINEYIKRRGRIGNDYAYYEED